ncbi:AI-2E family transporter [Aureimonas sp. AU12]|uniref:AI-2E family transporter n=1 Tax=Aureimonas sp. AU12 TaxID=1638161 RepID=UPI001FCD5A08|nr:AI-2E family transporter [Aureimonas sp. AU12]
MEQVGVRAVSQSQTASREPIPDLQSVELLKVHSGRHWAITGIFFILLFGALYLAASFVLPVVFALLFMLVLSPVVRFAKRRLHIWEPVTAGVLVFGTLIAILSAFYLTSGPLTQIASSAPTYIRAVNDEISHVRDRLARFADARETAREATGAPAPAAAAPENVVLNGPGLLDNAASVVPQVIASIGFALIFLFFLLSSGNLFYQKLIESMPTFSDKRKALAIAHEIERELSRYLLTITLINAGLGVAIGTAMWVAGLPMPAVFGVLAFVLNFIPYLGAIVGIGLVGVVGLADSGMLSGAILPAVLYLGVTSIEGQLITPVLVGRRLEMNAAAVFLAVAFWGWIWGVVGMFLAVPLMVGVKVFASYVDGLHPLANFLSAEKQDPPASESE